MSWFNPHVPRKRRSDPSKDSPRPQPHHITVAVAFLSFCVPGSLRFNSIPLPESNMFAFFADAATSRLCSAGKSVASCRRCRRFDALSFLGLCSPSRSFTRTSFRADDPVEQSGSRKRDLHCSCSAAHPSRATGQAHDREDHGGNHYGPKPVRYLERRHPKISKLNFLSAEAAEISNRAPFGVGPDPVESLLRFTGDACDASPSCSRDDADRAGKPARLQCRKSLSGAEV